MKFYFVLLAGDEEDDDDDEDDDDEDDDEEEEEEETGSKRARRDSSSSLGSSLSMDMPPLFSHNGVVGQTTSHLVASDHLSLNSLLSQSQSVYGHKGVLQNQSSGVPSHIAPSPVSASHGSGITNHSSQHTRSRKQKTIFNEIQASLTSSIRERKRLREEQPSDSEDDLVEDKAKNLTKKKGISAPNVVSPSSKSPNVKKARLMNRQESNDETRPINNQTQPVKKKSVAFADISSNIIRPTDIVGKNAKEEEGSKPPKIVLPSISDLIQNSTHPVKPNSEEDSQKPLLSNPEAINQDREQSKKRVKAMISDAFDEPDSDEEKETNKENDVNETQNNVINKQSTSTIVTGINFKFGDTTNKLPTTLPTGTVLPTEKSDATVPSIDTTNKEKNLPVDSQTPSKDKDALKTAPNASISVKFSQGENKLPEVPSTLQIISQTVSATSTSPPATTIQTLTTANTPIVTSGSSQLTNALSTSGFNFSAQTTKAQSVTDTTITPSLPTFSIAKTPSNATFTFSSKPSDIATTSPTLSSKSVLTALASPNFKSTFSIPTTSTGVMPSASQKVEPVPIITTTPSTTGGFQFSLGKPGVTSPIATLSGFPATVPTTTLPSSTTSISTTPSSGGFNFSKTSTSAFSFGPGNTIKSVGTALTNTGTPVTTTLASSTATAAVPPTITSNIFSFGNKNPPDITATKAPSSAVSPFTFGKTEDKLPAPTTTVPSSAAFSFGPSPPATSAHSSTLTGKPI